jgi:hypothetical protein
MTPRLLPFVPTTLLFASHPRIDPAPMPIAKTVRLNTGADMPVVGLGTWQSVPGQVEKAVEAALRIGKHRRLIDASAPSSPLTIGLARIPSY